MPDYVFGARTGFFTINFGASANNGATVRELDRDIGHNNIYFFDKHLKLLGLIPAESMPGNVSYNWEDGWTGRITYRHSGRTVEDPNSVEQIAGDVVSQAPYIGIKQVIDFPNVPQWAKDAYANMPEALKDPEKRISAQVRVGRGIYHLQYHNDPQWKFSESLYIHVKGSKTVPDQFWAFDGKGPCTYFSCMIADDHAIAEDPRQLKVARYSIFKDKIYLNHRQTDAQAAQQLWKPAIAALENAQAQLGITNSSAYSPDKPWRAIYSPAIEASPALRP